MIKIEFGEKLKEWRKKNKISQKELGEKLQVDQTQISNYEKGKSKPSIDGAIILCEMMNASLDWLLLDKEDIALRQDEKKLLEVYNALSETGRIKLEGALGQITRDEEEESDTLKSQERTTLSS